MDDLVEELNELSKNSTKRTLEIIKENVQLKVAVEKAKSGLNAILWNRKPGHTNNKGIEKLEEIAKYTLMMIDSTCAFCEDTLEIEDEEGNIYKCFQCNNLSTLSKMEIDAIENATMQSQANRTNDQ
jgi:peptide subunit release factor 1 (eRF1)